MFYFQTYNCIQANLNHFVIKFMMITLAILHLHLSFNQFSWN